MPLSAAGLWDAETIAPMRGAALGGEIGDPPRWHHADFDGVDPGRVEAGLESQGEHLPRTPRVAPNHHRPHRELQTGGAADGHGQFGSEFEIGDPRTPSVPKRRARVTRGPS